MNYQPVRSTGFVLSISSLWNVLLALHISWIVTKVCIFTQETDIMQLWEIRIVILKAVFKQRNLICIKLYGCVEFKFPYPPSPPPPCRCIWFNACYKNAIRLWETVIASDSGNLGFFLVDHWGNSVDVDAKLIKNR